MQKDKLILKNKTEIELEAGADLHALKVKSPDRQTMMEVWEQMTGENLAEIQIQNGAGLTIGRYETVMLSYPILVSEDSNGSVISTYCLREKTEEEKRLEALEQTVGVHEEALMDVAAVASALAEQVEIGGQ